MLASYKSAGRRAAYIRFDLTWTGGGTKSASAQKDTGDAELAYLALAVKGLAHARDAQVHPS